MKFKLIAKMVGHIHIQRTHKQLESLYKKRVKAGTNGFRDLEDFLDWYKDKPSSCEYCGLTEAESQEIAMTGLLTSNRFPQDGKIGRGTARAVWLEIERSDPKGKYSRDNCVLACYFCNNDKSDVFYGNTYREFLQDRAGYLRTLLNRK